eukprot:CAMPEP_0119108920 /NCGR_PEP_ID=MMETSP1180-20130426/16186_1 /TAXON_ID=3052 ORGANISM="Chlamydomonas cf sp, Strain CCMP681" /NCGR_SAMPLE_ID=MMETSP1180 /ASSEMBLY_ACC=CAM_ASM_000741 /LENGTH=91 /DNA_ID=CAMNT_0007094599 /DNA_START=218 /DNA_END=490 /DNA_ORIENTATION=+
MGSYLDTSPASGHNRVDWGEGSSLSDVGMGEVKSRASMAYAVSFTLPRVELATSRPMLTWCVVLAAKGNKSGAGQGRQADRRTDGSCVLDW